MGKKYHFVNCPVLYLCYCCQFYSRILIFSLYFKQDIHNTTLVCYYVNVFFVGLLFFVCLAQNKLYNFSKIWCSLVLKVGIFYTDFYDSGTFCSKRLKRRKILHSFQLLSLQLIKILTSSAFGSTPNVTKFAVIFVKIGKLVKKPK